MRGNELETARSGMNSKVIQVEFTDLAGLEFGY
jgi:hypothetical protein